MASTELVDGNPHRYRAADLHLAVEILSDGSRRVDRVLKSSEATGSVDLSVAGHPVRLDLESLTRR